MSNFTLNAQARADELQGKGASRRLRREARVPAIIYGGDAAPASVTLELRELVKVLEDNAFFSSVITIDVDGTKQQAIIKALQRHPAKNTPMHADFLRVKKGEEITVRVPLNFLNQETAKGVKAGGIVSFQATEVEVHTLPKNLPESIDVDLAALEIGDVVHLSDLKLPKGVSLTALEQGDDHNLAVVSITHAPQEEVDAASEDEADK